MTPLWDCASDTGFIFNAIRRIVNIYGSKSHNPHAACRGVGLAWLGNMQHVVDR